MAVSITKVVVAPPAVEVLSSFLVCAALLLVEVQVELLSRLPWYIIGVNNYNNQMAFLTMIFLCLAFVFSPSYVAVSRGAFNNPSVYALRGLLGEVGVFASVVGAFASILGHVMAFGALAYATTAYPAYFPGMTALSAVVPAGSLRDATLAETAVATSNFVFAGLAPGIFPTALLPMLGSAFYVATAVAEGCAYSCGYMNPATVIASHVVMGDATSREAIDAMAPYVLGSALGCLSVWFMVKFLLPEPKSAKKAKAQGKAAARGVSMARERTAALERAKSMAKSSSKKKAQ